MTRGRGENSWNVRADERRCRRQPARHAAPITKGVRGRPAGDYAALHPNDHVNHGQSINYVVPSAVKLAVPDARGPLMTALDGQAHAWRGRCAGRRRRPDQQPAKQLAGCLGPAVIGIGRFDKRPSALDRGRDDRRPQ